jgi:hypothetical protein
MPRKSQTDLIIQANFELIGNRYDSWLSSAEMLRQAAKTVKRAAEVNSDELPAGLMLDTYAVYAMLLGYVIECLLKGIWVKNGNPMVENGVLIGVRNVGDHELGQLAREVLAKDVGIKLTTAEANNLDRLSAFVRSFGRYPIPTTWEQTRPRKIPGRGKTVPAYFSKKDFQTAELLENRLRTILLGRDITSN